MGLLKKHPVLFLGAGLTLLFLILGFVRLGILDRLDYSVYDLMMHMRTDKGSASDIVLVNIDETSTTSLGRWPWPRSVLAGGIHKIKAGEPKAVGLTTVLSEPEQNPGLLELTALEKAFTQAGLGASGGGAAFLKAISDSRERLDNDRLLSEALQSAGNVVLPLYFIPMQVRGEPSGKTYPDWLERQALTEGVMEGEEAWQKSEKATFAIPAFAQAAKGMGHITLIPDSDGVVRSETPFFEYDGLLLPSLAVKLAQIALNVGKEKAVVNPGDKFELVFKNLLETLFVERMDQNEEIFARFMNDAAFQKVITGWLASETYKRLRAKAERISDLRYS